jgi:cytosine deaminase
MTVGAVRIPRSVRQLGLVGDVFDVEVVDASITNVTPSAPGTKAAGTLVPGLVDLHVHLDKTYTLDETGPAYGDLASAIALMAAHQPRWTPEGLTRRMTRALDECYLHGTRALRTHLDWNGPRPPSVDVFLGLKDRWAPRLTMQWVSLTALDRFDDPAFGDDLARQVKADGGVLGCFVYRNPGLAEKLARVFDLAVTYDLDLDFHVDEGLHEDARGLGAIADLALERGWLGRVTCGHVCSLSVQDDARATLDKVRRAGIHLVSLPTTNLFLQGSWTETPVHRGITRLKEARDAGVPTSLANDNVADPFFPYGTYDVLEAWSLGVQMAHLAPAEDWLDAVTVTPAQTMGLAWDGRVGPGAPADFLVLEAPDSFSLMNPQGRRRRICRQGNWI